MKPESLKPRQKNIQPTFVFEKSQDEKDLYNSPELVRLHAFGLSLANDVNRPFLLLKDEKEELVLPVAINPLEAGVTLTQSNTKQFATTPHHFTEMLLESFDVKMDRCIFSEIKGHHQYVRLYMIGHPRYGSFKLRADEAMSLCLHLETPIYATRTFIHRSKIMSAEIGDGQGMNVGPNPHSYLM